MNKNSKFNLKKISKRGLVYGKLASIGIATFIASLYVGKNIAKEYKQEKEASTKTYSLYAGVNQMLYDSADLKNASVIIGSNDTYEVELANEEADSTFEYEYEDRSNHEKIANASNYDEIFEKYSNMYGLDKTLLRAICAQESGGNSDVARGLMQISPSLYGKNIHAYNFETGEKETETIDASRISDPDYNIRLASMLLQCYVDEFEYDIARGVTAYNLGNGTLRKLSEDNWINEREALGIGDAQYFEHVFSFIEDGTVLTFRKVGTNEYTTFKLDNNNVDSYVKVK